MDAKNVKVLKIVVPGIRLLRPHDLNFILQILIRSGLGTKDAHT